MRPFVGVTRAGKPVWSQRGRDHASMDLRPRFEDRKLTGRHLVQRIREGRVGLKSGAQTHTSEWFWRVTPPPKFPTSNCVPIYPNVLWRPARGRWLGGRVAECAGFLPGDNPGHPAILAQTVPCVKTLKRTGSGGGILASRQLSLRSGEKCNSGCLTNKGPQCAPREHCNVWLP